MYGNYIATKPAGNIPKAWKLHEDPIDWLRHLSLEQHFMRRDELAWPLAWLQENQLTKSKAFHGFCQMAMGQNRPKRYLFGDENNYPIVDYLKRLLGSSLDRGFDPWPIWELSCCALAVFLCLEIWALEIVFSKSEPT